MSGAGTTQGAPGTFRSIRTRLIAVVGAVGLSAAILLSWSVGNLAADQIKEDKGILMAQLAAQMMRELDKGVYERQREMKIVASLRVVRDPAVPLAEKRALFEALKASYQNYAWIGMTDDQGNILVGTDGLLVGKNVAKRAWFQRGSRGPHVGDVHDAFLLASILPKPKHDFLPLRLLDVSTPIRDDDGRLIGVLCGHLSWDWGFEVRNALLEPFREKNLAEVVILNNKGNVLLGTPELAELKENLDLSSYRRAREGENAFTTEPWPDGKRYLTGFAPSHGFDEYAGLGWTALVRQETRRAFAPATRLGNHTLAITATVAALLLAILWVVIGRLTRPMTAIAEVAERIRTGTARAEDIPATVGRDEVAILSGSLRKLVSELEAKNRELRLSATFFDYSTEGILITDGRERIVSCNQALYAITGFQSHELLGERPSVLSSGRHEASYYREMWRDIHEKGSWSGEIWNQRRDGEIYPEWLTISAVPDESGEVVNYVGIFTDIGELKRKEQELILAKEAAEAGSRTKTEFLAVISHELRTPMNAILGMTGLLAETSLSKEQREFLGIQERAGNSLMTLIEDLLDITKLENGKLELHCSTIGLRELLSSTQAMVMGGARERGLNLTVNVARSLPDRRHGDEARIRQILTNLIGNAIKFTYEGGVSVTVEGVPDGGDNLIFTVSDTGIGIDDEQRRRIFELFTQADSSMTRGYGGTGLGLTICSRLVALMNGRMWFESTPGAGSRFSFSLPLPVAVEAPPDVPEAPVSAPDAPSREGGERGCRILLAEDVANNTALIRSYLAHTPHTLVCVENGAEAVSAYQREPFDLVLMDLQMPVLDGWEATRRIRAWEREMQRPPCPILALTAHALKGDEEASREAGCNDHLTKPIKKAHLLEAIARHVEGA